MALQHILSTCNDSIYSMTLRRVARGVTRCDEVRDSTAINICSKVQVGFGAPKLQHCQCSKSTFPGLRQHIAVGNPHVITLPQTSTAANASGNIFAFSSNLVSSSEIFQVAHPVARHSLALHQTSSWQSSMLLLWHKPLAQHSLKPLAPISNKTQ